jgi:hypothetical protein
MWNELKNLYININSGSLSEGSLAIMARAFPSEDSNQIVPNIEYKRTSSMGVVTLDNEVYSDNEYRTFIYHNGEKIEFTENVNELLTDVIDDYVMIHYYYEEISDLKQVKINKKDLPNFKMECLATIYDKSDGNTRKMLLSAEKVSLQNGFNLLLGPNVGPNIVNLSMAALPDRNKDFIDYRIY